MTHSHPGFTSRLEGQSGPKPGNGFRAFPLAEIEQSIAGRFRTQVARNPDAVAIRDAEGTLSYGELNACSNRVAQAILALDLPPARGVALLLETSRSQVVGLLAVLKAGRFYVPVDPALPTARIAAILDDTAPALLVVCNSTKAQALAAAHARTPILNLDALAEGLPACEPGVGVSPDALAYVLYTSGTTGRPKGVMQNQRNVLHNVLRHTDAFQIGCGDRQTLLYSYSVYGGTRDIFNALLNGATLHAYSVARHGVSGLAQWLRQERITIYCSVATVFRHLFQTLAPPAPFPDLRLIKLGGEATYLRDVDRLRPLLSEGCVVHCGLGATETGLARTYWVNRDSEIECASVPLGYEVEGVETLLLDESGQPVMTGEVGEIVIQSRYLALGYWGNEQLSRTCFSMLENAELRQYRTGDLGVMNADGCLEHRGRKDFQVKIRGNRVELAEVEQSLLDLPEVAEAVVLAKQDSQGEARLVAYVVPKPDHECTLQSIRRTLAGRLPNFMLPEAMVAMTTLPQLSNGKIDRQALPQPTFQISRQRQAYAPAQTPFEHELVRIWEKTLKLEGVGTDDNFFELGGHSLQATRILAEFAEVLGTPIPVNVLFENPTIRELALQTMNILTLDEKGL